MTIQRRARGRAPFAAGAPRWSAACRHHGNYTFADTLTRQPAVVRAEQNAVDALEALRNRASFVDFDLD